jgi:hypothetical protein
MTTQDGVKVSLMQRPPLPPGNTAGTHFCWRLRTEMSTRDISWGVKAAGA